MFHTASIVNRGVALSQRRTLPGRGSRQQECSQLAAGVIPSTKSALESARLGKYPGKLNASQVSRAIIKEEIPEFNSSGKAPASHRTACATYGEFTISTQNGRSERYGDR
nr:MAG TPA: hypothetical protein [Caudoviricetes sp.]